MWVQAQLKFVVAMDEWQEGGDYVMVLIKSTNRVLYVAGYEIELV